ncbi:MAG: hypothetical protein CL677_06775 [Bdellovibrionaceae bacterium]|nr:hypothetical protein [Pseudobdellovibrionaceae bacterium]|tara:strand:+ start:119919 stop:120164 length:246 start_codon:yes stop_codon:yes gene_type:complete
MLGNQKGQGVIEYLILVALMGVATIGMVKLLQSGVNTQLANVVNALRGEKTEDLRPKAPSKRLYREQDMSEFSNHATNKDK